MRQYLMCAVWIGTLAPVIAQAQWGRQNRESPPRGGGEDRKAAVDEAASAGGKTAPVMPNSGSGWRGPSGGRAPGPLNPDASALDINRASEIELRLIPGLAPEEAKRIVEMRPYASPEDLVTKKVLPQATLDTIRKRITARPLAPRSTKRQKKEAPAKKAPRP